MAFPFPDKNNHLVKIDRLVLKGLDRTDKTWLTEYAGLESLPVTLSQESLSFIKDKLLSTRVFKRVELRVTEHAEPSDFSVLEITVEEKWTLIPVLRAQTGGGTPLLVAGSYNTHSFGQYLTLGGEFRKYGDAPPGSVIFAKGPASWRGHPDWALELWRDVRFRHEYHSDDRKTGHSEYKGFRFRGRALWGTRWFQSDQLKLGFDALFYKYQDVLTIADQTQESLPLKENAKAHSSLAGRLWLMLQYDDIVADNIQYDGLRVLIRQGMGREQSARPFYSGESEIFWYTRPTSTLNLGFHFLGAVNHTDSVFGRYYLGGFDSVRGLPDGVDYGNKIWYTNAELRYLSQTWDKVWLQSVGFVDVGKASDQLFLSDSGIRSAAGVGIRVVVPKIYRFVIRLDYAWALDRSGQRGFSAGLNHLFQPYRPL